MSHEVESMMFTGKTPWHGLGHRFVEPPATVEEAMSAAGLDWEVELKPLLLEDGREVPEAKATVRSTDGAVLGVVGTRFVPVQNADAFRTFQPFLDAGEASIESAGSLRGGRRVWVLARLNRDAADVVKGDPIAKYLLLSHGHDGKLVINYGFTPVRVVCANTERMARESGGSELLRIKHTTNAVRTIEQARDIVNAADARFEATVEQYRALARAKVDADTLERYVQTVFNVVAEGEDARDRDELAAKTVDRIEAVTRLFDEGRGNRMRGVRGTMWAAYNGVTEYLNHERGEDREQRLTDLWFGGTSATARSAAWFNQNALDVAVRMAA